MKKYLVFLVIVLALVGGLFWQHKRIVKISGERDRYKGNTETLIGDVEKFKVRDSLNAARVQSLELSIKEFERFRAEDADLIKELRKKNRDLSEVNSMQSQTIIELISIPRDTVIIRDSVQVPALTVRCGDAWYDFEGTLSGGVFTGRMQSRDSLLIAETVRYKRFLGFLWKTKRIEDRELNCVSRNPHTEIMGLEHIVIEKK